MTRNGAIPDTLPVSKRPTCCQKGAHDAIFNAAHPLLPRSNGVYASFIGQLSCEKHFISPSRLPQKDVGNV